MSSPPRPRKTSENSWAPITITNTSELIRVVARMTSVSVPSR